MTRPARLYLVHLALLTLGLAIWGLLFNLAILAFGYPRDFLALLNTVAVLAAALLSPLLWWLSIRIGLRASLVWYAVAQTFALLVFGVWPEPTPLLVAVAVAGATQVLSQLSAQPFMMRHSDPHSRDRIFSTSAAIAIGIGGVGSLLAGILPGVLALRLGVAAESATAYRAAFIVAALIAGLSLVPLLLVRETRRQETGRQGDRETRRPGDKETGRQGDRETGVGRLWFVARGRFSVLGSRFLVLGSRSLFIIRSAVEPWLTWRILKLLLPPFVVSWGAALLIPYLNLFFKERFGVTDAKLGLIFAGLGIATGLATLGGPMLSRRMGRMRAVALAQVLSLPFLLLLGFTPVLAVAVGAALARAALFNMGWPLYDAYALEHVDEPARPTFVGIVGAASSVGYIIAPAISIAVQQRYGFTPLFLVTTLCYAIASALIYSFFIRPTGKVGVRSQKTGVRSQ